MLVDNARARFRKEVARPMIGVAVFLTLIVTTLIIWSTHSVDRLASARQQALVSMILDQSRTTVGHDQESTTYWDDSFRKTHERPLDPDWFDDNLGIWFHSYYGYDRAYILDPNDKAIYAMIDGVRAPPGAFEKSRPTFAPSVARFRAMLREPERHRRASNAVTLGLTDVDIVDGHPAILSLKPIAAETPGLTDAPGREYLHVVVRYLDGSFANDLSRRYWLADARYTTEASDDEATVPIIGSSGKIIGYFAWKPFRPGQTILTVIAPPLLAVFAVICAGIGILLRQLLARSLDLQASEAQAQHLAFHDTLTGLANRALFEDRLELALAGVRREQHPVALLYLDLDRFKKVNDTQGHSAGDELIRMVAQRLITVTRATDTVARLGGDEFAIILSNAGSVAEIEMLGQRMIATIGEPFDLDGGIAEIGVSIGIAIAPLHGVDRAELSRKADIALYDAKANGRGRSTVFAEQMDESIRVRQRIEQDLRRAMARNDELMLYYQPIIDIRTGRMCGVEALIRWRHPALGMVPPAQFVPIAEEAGLVEQLGDWVLERACTDAQHWSLETIAVNISPIQLRNPGFAQRALAIVDDCGFDPRRLELEITETCLIDSAEECQPNIAALRERGVRLALDDFGTGYSSFNHFRQLKVDRLKIDRSFVAAITPDAPESAIIKAIVDLAASAGMAVTAEGVETNQQSRYLTQVGCIYLQGWHHGRAQPADSITELIRIAPVRDVSVA